ncbi:hypothetical protein M434DRAFT_10557 [Hypoxylon sp. CO27-5]|nr:hypothetical protein M434DRAFT_10557 [Hypoxylon sp. CO27-5]
MLFKILGLLVAMVVAHHPPARIQSNTSEIETREFIQKVNHTADAGPETFKQRYQLITQYFEPGGPILFIQSAEAGMATINASDFVDYAPKLGALVAMLEHRFFGDFFGGSYPSGYDPMNVSNDSLKSLTLDNVLQDGVNFVNWIKGTIHGAKNSRVVYGGSSYGGFLAVSARMRYPHVFYGAVASSPALNSFGPLGSNRYKFDSAKWASDVYEDTSKKASAKINIAMTDFKKCISVSKFNYPWIEKYPTAEPFRDLVDKTLVASTVGEVLRIPLLAASWNRNESSCIDAFNGNISKASTGNIASNQPAFGYIACTYYPINDRSVPSGNIFPEYLARGDVDICTNPAWKAVDYGRQNEYFLQKFAITSNLLDATERLLVVQGRYDRTAAIGSPSLTVTDSLNHSRVIIVDAIAHAEDSVSEAIEPRGMKPQMDQPTRYLYRFDLVISFSTRQVVFLWTQSAAWVSQTLGKVLKRGLKRG